MRVDKRVNGRHCKYMLSQSTMDAVSKPSNKSRPRHSNGIQQSVVIQRIVFEKLKEAGLKAAELSGLARAWCDVNEEKRKLAMRPLPRSIDVSKLAKRGRKSTAAPAEEPSEPGLVPPAT